MEMVSKCRGDNWGIYSEPKGSENGSKLKTVSSKAVIFRRELKLVMSTSVFDQREQQVCSPEKSKKKNREQKTIREKRATAKHLWCES